ncbi:MAG: acyl-CoA thioesterase [Ruminococcus flavefaciens]|nr:acyl-CoA thioesterase [Ruminococcus flavefaciens]
MNRIYPYERKVYYYETDKMGIVHHSNYIRIFEESRMHFLQQAGMPYEKIEEAGLLVPILSVKCFYRKPLTFDEPFAVYPEITKFNGVMLNIDYKIFSRKTGELCITGNSSQGFTDRNLKPIRTKLKYPEIYNAIATYLNYKITD